MLSSEESLIALPDSVLDARTPHKQLVGAARAALRPESKRQEVRELDASTGASTEHQRSINASVNMPHGRVQQNVACQDTLSILHIG